MVCKFSAPFCVPTKSICKGAPWVWSGTLPRTQTCTLPLVRHGCKTKCNLASKTLPSCKIRRSTVYSHWCFRADVRVGPFPPNPWLIIGFTSVYCSLVIKARKALPELMSILSAGTKGGNESDDTLAMACQAVNSLIMREPEMNKYLLNNNLINSLKDLSENT